MNNFTKKDLKNGMYVETRMGNRYILIDDKMLRDEGFLYLHAYNEDLTIKDRDAEEFDIVKVFNTDTRINFENDTNLIWERKASAFIQMNQSIQRFS